MPSLLEVFSVGRTEIGDTEDPFEEFCIPGLEFQSIDVRNRDPVWGFPEALDRIARAEIAFLNH